MASAQSILLLTSAAAAGALAAWMWRGGWFGRSAPDPAVARHPLSGRRDVGAIEAPIWLIAAILVQMGVVLGASVSAAGLADGSIGGEPGWWIGGSRSLGRAALAQAGGYAAALLVGAVVLWLIRRSARAPEGGIKVDNPTPAPSPSWSPWSRGRHGSLADRRAGMVFRLRDLPLGLLGVLMIAPFYLLTSQASEVIRRLTRPVPEGAIRHTTLERLQAELTAPRGQAGVESLYAWMIVGLVVVVVPVIEELMYRGFLQSGLARFWARPEGRPSRTRPWAAILATSAIFAAMHALTGAVPWSAAAGLFVLSIGLGAAFERTGSLGVPIVMHGAFNAGNIAAVALGAGGG